MDADYYDADWLGFWSRKADKAAYDLELLLTQNGQNNLRNSDQCNTQSV
jgi:hypothetical protein